MTEQIEMHPQRWGNPANATSLPESARGLIELAFGVNEQPAVAGATPPAPVIGADALAALAEVVGADQVIVDDAIRALRTRGKSTPDLLKARVRRPERRARRGRPPRRPGRDRGAPRRGRGPPPRGRALRWRDVGHRWPRRRACAVRRSREPGPGPDEALVAVDKESMTATLEPGLRGPEAEALLAEQGLTLGSLPAVLRVRHDRRLRGHPLERAVQRRLRPLRRARRRPHRRHAVGHHHRRLRPGQRRRPRPAPGVPRLRGRARRHHRGHRAGARAARGQGVRRLALALLRRRRRRDAHAGAGRPAADRDPALRRGRDRDQPGRPVRHRRRRRTRAA